MFKAFQNLNGTDLSKHVSLTHSQTRRAHDLKLNHLPARSDVFKFPFFPRTIPVWKSLSQAKVHAVSPASFNARVNAWRKGSPFRLNLSSNLFLLLTIVCLHNEMQCLPVIHHM